MRGLVTLARAHGIQARFRDNSGTTVQAQPEALVAVLASLGVEAGTEHAIQRSMTRRLAANAAPGMEPVTVCRYGAPGTATVRLPRVDGSIHCTVTLEGGEQREWDADGAPLSEGSGPGCARPVAIAIPPLPMGYHHLALDTRAGRFATTVIAAPRRARPLEGPAWGLFAPLYALRSGRNAGTGDMDDLDAFCTVAARRGASLAGTLPLLAAFLDEPFEPSPYAPVSRCAWNELYAAVEPGDGAGAAGLRAAPLVDYRGVAKIKRRAIAGAADHAFGTDAWAPVASFADEKPPIEAYARFRAAMVRKGATWRTWESPARQGKLHDAELDQAEYRYQLYAQWLVDEQIRSVAARARERGVGLYLDFPVGVHPDGFDAWRHQRVFAEGCNVGAPPDGFFAGGQDWGFRPMQPEALRAKAYEPLIEALRHHMAVAGVLRIDHVMGLHRLYWVPHGLGAKEGAYVRYPADDLYAVLCLESVRSGVPIVGEDLGTVPGEVRQAMVRRGLSRMYVVQTELRAGEPVLEPPPAGSVASLNTHDMPPFAAFWHGDDLAPGEAGSGTPGERRQLHLRLAALLESQGLLRHGERDPATVARAALQWLATTSAAIVLVNIEDLWGERQPQNVPGTSTERPNWRRKLRHTIEELQQLPALDSLAQAITGTGGNRL